MGTLGREHDSRPLDDPRRIWDSFTDALGWCPETRPERGKWNAAIRDWRAVGLSAADVGAYVDAYVAVFPDVNANPRAVVNHVGELRPIVEGRVPAPRPRRPYDHTQAMYDDMMADVEAAIAGRNGNGNGRGTYTGGNGHGNGSTIEVGRVERGDDPGGVSG